MKTLTNKLVMSVLALVLTGVALSVGVFAWFTINNTANVESFTANIQTGEGLYVSANGTDWKNTLTNADLGTAITGKTFVPLHTVDGVTLQTLVDFETLGTPQGSDYIEFTLQFVGSSALTNLQLSNISISSEDFTSWIPGVDVEGTPSEGNPNIVIEQYAANAVRVSFEDLVSSAVKVFEREVDGVNDNTSGKGDYLTNHAILFYNEIMGVTLDQTLFNAALADTELIPAGTGLSTVVGTVSTTAISGLTWTVPSAVTNVIGTNFVYFAVTVRVYVDGWDQEAYNAILSGQLAVSFAFRAQ